MSSEPNHNRQKNHKALTKKQKEAIRRKKRQRKIKRIRRTKKNKQKKN